MSAVKSNNSGGAGGLTFRLTAIADPTRRGIVELLARGEQSAGEIVKRFSVSAPAISQHLKVLREAGLAKTRIEGQRRVYSLKAEGFDEIDAWLQRTRAFWSDRLDLLEAELSSERQEAEPKSRRADSSGNDINQKER